MFAADTHEAGNISVDITTKPGLERWRGATNAGFRGSALNARNAFAPIKADERNERYGFSASGPLWAKHTSLAFSADGTDAFDSKTIVTALPTGYFADSIRKPNTALNLSGRMEHTLSKSQVLRAEAQRNHTFSDNLGVGDFDLPSAATARRARTIYSASRRPARFASPCSTTSTFSSDRKKRRTHPPASHPPSRC
jgi:hypothetical protein